MFQTLAPSLYIFVLGALCAHRCGNLIRLVITRLDWVFDRCYWRWWRSHVISWCNHGDKTTTTTRRGNIPQNMNVHSLIWLSLRNIRIEGETAIIANQPGHTTLAIDTIETHDWGDNNMTQCVCAPRCSQSFHTGTVVPIINTYHHRHHRSWFPSKAFLFCCCCCLSVCTTCTFPRSVVLVDVAR